MVEKKRELGIVFDHRTSYLNYRYLFFHQE